MRTSAHRILAKALAKLPAPGRDANVHLALSGGVDSSVAGFLLRERGYTVKPTLLQCWDKNQDGEPPCFEHEKRHAEAATRALKLSHDLQVIDLVATYWNEVFEKELLSGLRAGRTPNADLACNRHVKFGAFPKYIRRTYGNDVVIATGHYAQVRQTEEGVSLLRGADKRKDQSYFLASVHGKDLQGILMPVGSLHKTEVRELAEWAGLPAAKQRSSRGLCFVGKKDFPRFVQGFLEGRAGRFVRAGCGSTVARCDWPAWAYTIGQGARIGGLESKLFVVGKVGHDVVVTHADDARLWTRSVVCRRVDWVDGCAPQPLGDLRRVGFKWSSRDDVRFGHMRLVQDGGVEVRFDLPERRAAEGQAVVLYDGEVCLGAAWPVDQNDISLFDDGASLVQQFRGKAEVQR